MQANMQPLHGASRAACLECGLAALLSARSIPGGEGGHYQQVVAPSSCMCKEPGTCSAGRPLGKCQDALALAESMLHAECRRFLFSRYIGMGRECQAVHLQSLQPASSLQRWLPLVCLEDSRRQAFPRPWLPQSSGQD